MKLSEILYQHTNDQLKRLTRMLERCGGATRKDDLVGCIVETLTRPEKLRPVWDNLDALSQKAVGAAFHNDGEFNASAFVAQYGQLPERPQSRWFWQQEPILLDLFIYDGILPQDLRPLLEPLVPPPERFKVQGLKNAPTVVLEEGGYTIPLIRAETERAGLHDLVAYLRLAEQGNINCSSTTGNTTVAGIKKILNVMLAADDFLPLPDKFRANQTIRPFGLDTFAREAGLVKYTKRSGLHLTALGRQFYQSQEPALLLEAFESWTHADNFDELSRISALRGLNARGTRLTKPGKRREAIIEALSWCPVDVWINIEDFYRGIKIWHFDFEVETTPFSNLYVGSQEYGMMRGENYWIVTKGLFTNVILWEYLASIGAVDLLYVRPEEADIAWSYDFYYDDEALSDYDGLKYFRINRLGAYLLGQAGEYRPSVALEPKLLEISPDKQVTITDPARLTPNDQHQLELLAEPLKAGGYRLDTQRLLTAIEAGQEWPQLWDFLGSRHSGPLPEEIQNWFEQLRQNSQAFKVQDQALLIKASSPELVEMTLADRVLKRFCRPVDSTTLVVPAGKEKDFRARLKELEYVLTSG